MPDLVTIPPARRPELAIHPLGDQGRYVVKDPRTGEYYTFGEQEGFLLEQLDGRHSAEEICTAFRTRFGEALSEDDLAEFVDLARTRGFLQMSESAERTARSAPTVDQQDASRSAPHAPRSVQSLLYWRKSLFDPDRLFTWLEPKLRFFWTRTFLFLSLGCIFAAAVLVWTSRDEVVSSFTSALRWQTLLLAWLTLALVTTGHEFAHGLTCKHHGGEVHEVGFLLMLFLPCFFCNVSDAWLFREKSKRLGVMLAGGYLDLFLWALAVFVWRLTVQDSMVNYLAWVVLSVCGVRVFFNFNPLLKLDGYYLLSDWLEIPNLRQRALAYWMGHVRWLLWGAPRPARPSRGTFLFGFGLACWLFSIFFLTLMLVSFGRFLGTRLGWPGWGAMALLGLVLWRGLFQGFSAGEAGIMFAKRHKRALVWLVVLGGLAAVLCLVEMEDWASGSFCLRPVTRAEVRAPVTGFLSKVYFDEGDRVSPGELVACLEVPDLASRITQKDAEVREAEAKLQLLEAGPRDEEVLEQRARVERASAWRDLAQKDLTQARQALQAELARLDKQIAQYQAELEAAQDRYTRAKNLRGKAALAEEQYKEAERKRQVVEAQLGQVQSQKRHREALGTREAIAGLDAEAELVHREKDLAEARAALNLLRAGTRPEEIEAGRARLARLREEVRQLKEQQRKQDITAPVSGLITTAHLREKEGQYLREGDLICVVEEPASREVEVVIAEEDVARVRTGQVVKLKVRALPFEAFATQVDRVASAAERNDLQSRVTVYCRFDHAPGDLRTDMTGYARVYTGRRPIGGILLDRALRLIRTEFWW